MKSTAKVQNILILTKKKFKKMEELLSQAFIASATLVFLSLTIYILKEIFTN